MDVDIEIYGYIDRYISIRADYRKEWGCLAVYS